MVADPQHNDKIISVYGGIPMTAEAFEQLINIESPYRYELIDGVAYDMTGSTPEHADITFNIMASLKEQLGKQGPCRVYQEQYVFIPGEPSVVPDVVVTCDVGDWEKDKRLKPFKIRSPLLVVEVLSPSTASYDRSEKFKRYKQSPTLAVYMLVEQDERHVEVYRRATNWKRELFSSDHIIKLDQLDLILPMAAIYEGLF